MWRSPQEQLVFIKSELSSNVNGTHCLVTSSDSIQTPHLTKPWRCKRLPTRVDEHHRGGVAHAVALEPRIQQVRADTRLPASRPTACGRATDRLRWKGTPGPYKATRSSERVSEAYSRAVASRTCPWHWGASRT